MLLCTNHCESRMTSDADKTSEKSKDSALWIMKISIEEERQLQNVKHIAS